VPGKVNGVLLVAALGLLTDWLWLSMLQALLAEWMLLMLIKILSVEHHKHFSGQSISGKSLPMRGPCP
jgi:hypothetical protein